MSKKKDPKKEKPTMSKEDFLEFLSSSTPKDLNQFLIESGKSKPFCPISIIKPKQ